MDGFADPVDIAKKCKEYGYKAAALTDHGSLSGCVKFSKACKEQGIKPILGCELYVCEGSAEDKSKDNKDLAHAVVLAKNLAGWQELVQCVSTSYDHLYYKPRVDHAIMKKYLGNGNHFCVTGHPGTEISDCLFQSKAVYDCRSVEEVEALLVPNWEEVCTYMIRKYQDIFGDNLRLEIQLIDAERLFVARVIGEKLRYLGKKLGVKTIATADSHYVNREDAEFQRILLCSNLGRTLHGVQRDLAAGKSVPLGGFFMSDNYHIPSLDELKLINTDEEILNAFEVGEECEHYEILSAPQLPHFDYDKSLYEDEFALLTQMCRDGWKEHIAPLVKSGKISKELEQVYVARVKEELDIIQKANLSGYFLIVQDIVQFVKSKGWLPGVGRGSAAGCLVSYLIGITKIDPIPFKLLFSRFYNAGRIGTLPDIDLDVPTKHRGEVIEYVKNKYGQANVSQICTFNTLMGRSAVKEVLRICAPDITHAEANDITKYIPDKAEIADELEATGETSIIRWALANRPQYFKKWVTMDDDGNLSGDLAEYFQKAILIEGTPKSQGKHAAGVVISTSPLNEVCPIVRDKDKNPIAGFEMGDLEALGLVKMDILGIRLLDKIMDVSYAENIDINAFDDKDTWDMISSGDVKGVFQIERQGRWTKLLKPENIHHLAALVAIIRPGVVEAMLDGKSMTQHYIDRKNGIEPVEYFHPALEPILKDTYGIIIYQESAMLIASQLAGFTLDEADNLRKAIGKKKVDLMAKAKAQFLEGAKKVGILNEQEAAQIFEWIEKSQRYSFNASHSYAYAVDAFHSAICKNKARKKFYEAYLNNATYEQDSQEQVRELINDAKLFDIEVLPPRLDHFYPDFLKSDNKNQIYFGVGHIKDVGVKDIEILFGQEYDFANMNWMELLMTFSVKGSKVNAKSFRALIMSGALTGKSNKLSRERMAYEYKAWSGLTEREIAFIRANYVETESLEYHIRALVNGFKITASRLNTVNGILSSLKNPSYSLEDDPLTIATSERYYFGTSITCGETDYVYGVDSNCKDIRLGVTQGRVSVAVKLVSVREHKIKKAGDNQGKLMAFLAAEDSSAEMPSFVVFPSEYEKAKPFLYEGNTVLIHGETDMRGGEVSVKCNRIFQI